MKAKKKICVVILPVIFVAILLIGYLFYTPPLLNERGYNLPGRVYDFFAYAYYSIHVQWAENEGEDQEARRAAALTAWHRPSRMEELLRIKPDDLFQLGREYAARGLEREACRLFKEALPAALPDEEKSLEVISYLALLGDWRGAAKAAARLLKRSPDSAEAEYWRGRSLLEMNRSDRAADHLRRAFQLQPDQMDALFQVGRLEEQAGKKKVARSLYERVVARAPGHLGAWEGLARLYDEEGEMERVAEARNRCAGLTPLVSVEEKYGNSFILSGYCFSEGVLTTGGPLELEIYLNGWRPRSVSLQPEVVLAEPGRPDRYSLTGEVIELPGPGEVVKKKLSWKLPPVIYPGTIDWRLAFSEPVPPVGREGTAVERKLIPLPSFQLKPGWTSAVDRGRLVREYFGTAARALGKSTFLGPGAELELSFNDGEMAEGVGIVSCLHRGSSIPQGEAVGWISVKTEEGDDQAYPVIAGKDTAEVWWEFAEPWRRKHQQAPIFISWQVDSGKKQFKAHEYYAILSFPRPLTVKDLTFRNCSEKSGWYISDIVLIPPGS